MNSKIFFNIHHFIYTWKEHIDVQELSLAPWSLYSLGVYIIKTNMKKKVKKQVKYPALKRDHNHKNTTSDVSVNSGIKVLFKSTTAKTCTAEINHGLNDFSESIREHQSVLSFRICCKFHENAAAYLKVDFQSSVFCDGGCS